MNVRFEVIFVIVLCSAPLFNGSAVFAAESREEIEAFLSAPSAVEVFKSTKGQNSQVSDNRESPLVKQAQAFALYLDPPPKPQPRDPMSPGQVRTSELRPVEISAKFELIGTCYYAANPEMSLALIREPTKQHWVRQGSKVGRLIIEKIDDGKATIRDAQRTFELVALRVPKPSLVKSGPGINAGAANIQVPGLTQTAAAVESMPEMNAEETALLDKFFSEMEALGSGESASSPEETEKATALMDQLMVELEKARISTEEANELDNLGQQLRAEQSRQGARELQQIQSQQPAAPSQKVDTNRLPPPPPRRSRTTRPARPSTR